MPDPFVPQFRLIRALLVVCMVAVALVASPLLSVAATQAEAPLETASIEVSESLPVDSDGDSITDDDEVSVYGTNPLLADTDGDGITDDDEVFIYGTNPLLADTDGDGVSDGVEIANSTDPLAAPIPTLTPTTVPPTQVPTAVPPTPAPVLPTPTPTGSGDFSVQRIVSGSGCTQVSSTDIVQVDTAVEFHCNAADGPGNSDVTRRFSDLTVGWEYQVNDEPWRSAAGAAFSQKNAIPEFILRLRPTGIVVPGSEGVITVRLSTSSGTGGYTATVGATLQAAVAPTAADLQLVCNPASVSAQVNAARLVSCTYSGKASLNTRQITLTRITVPVPAGWSITSPVGSATATTLTIMPNTVIAYSATSTQSYTFSYTLTPACTAPTTAQPINLTSTFSFNSTTGIAGATFSQQATRLNTSSLAMSISSNSLVWNKPYSLVTSTLRGNLTYQVVANGCSGWNIQVSASPFQYIGPNNGISIPASNLRLTATGNPIAVSGGSTGVSRQAASGPMNTPLKVMNATARSGNGTYQQQLDFNLTIPGRSVAGTYQSTITVTSAAAP